jgi:FkbM family methyltransferase
MFLHNDPAVAEWDRRILDELTWHYDYPAMFDWRDMRRILDVGAHIGGFALWAKQHAPDALIVGIEPEPENAQLAASNTAKLGAGVTILRGAIWYGDDLLALHPFPEAANAGSHKLTAWHEGETVYKPLLTLELVAAICAFGSVDLIKLDCEGAEYPILARASEELLRGVKVIVGEYHDGPERFRRECVARLAPWFDVVFLMTTAPLGRFCLVNKGYTPCG